LVFKSLGFQEPWFSRALLQELWLPRALVQERRSSRAQESRWYAADRTFVPFEGKSALLLAAAQSKCGIELVAGKAGLRRASANHSKSSVVIILGGAS
jgi:hypothetical protein